ncbi:hypothetical protein A2372_02995 [Candidatus Wolfebacteria bacterium RIFOXYB1_FULL_54_12]|uniref:Uncharacterized protein n=1 Tax=Candidatus Wolfebacteria bacterium RIFOXYB1_FULL_54_12 TaxID=1802559 RepID=A0A1F8DXR6_9BACT|nr:MAG: hypothetical protein A2372_02995 [Candidatus Wolfebacteria bacterium RIFOXYB1_FULL_54_12]
MKKIVIILSLLYLMLAVPAFAETCYGPFCPDSAAVGSTIGWANNNNGTDEQRYGANKFGFTSENDTVGGLSTRGNAQATVVNGNVYRDARYQSGSLGEAPFTSSTENRLEMIGSSSDQVRGDFSDAFINLGHDANGFAHFGSRGFNTSLYATGAATFNGTGNVDALAGQSTYDTLRTNHHAGHSETSVSTKVGVKTN